VVCGRPSIHPSIHNTLPIGQPRPAGYTHVKTSYHSLAYDVVCPPHAPVLHHQHCCERCFSSPRSLLEPVASPLWHRVVSNDPPPWQRGERTDRMERGQNSSKCTLPFLSGRDGAQRWGWCHAARHFDGDQGPVRLCLCIIISSFVHVSVSVCGCESRPNRRCFSSSTVLMQRDQVGGTSVLAGPWPHWRREGKGITAEIDVSQLIRRSYFTLGDGGWSRRADSEDNAYCCQRRPCRSCRTPYGKVLELGKGEDVV
jgi:hypothetical protein